MTTAGLGLAFRVLASGDGVWFQGLGVGILKVQTSSWRALINCSYWAFYCTRASTKDFYKLIICSLSIASILAADMGALGLFCIF